MTDEKQPKTFKGTTTVAITFNGGVVLAADKRASMGTFIGSREAEKIHLVGEKIAMTIAGGVGDAQSLVRLLKAEMELYRYSKGAEMPVKGAATLLSNVLQGNKYYPYLVQLIIAGVDSEPRLYDLDPFGGLIKEDYASTGSGSVVAYGLLDEHFKKGMTRDEAVKLAAKAVNSALKRDSATGDGIDLLCISGDGAKRYSKDEVAKLL
ncbi:MAG: archaeal proteasome endopeptidase complex subunit beta [Candidatus Micrarchaeota archaeon]